MVSKITRFNYTLCDYNLFNLMGLSVRSHRPCRGGRDDGERVRECEAVGGGYFRLQFEFLTLERIDKL